MESYPVVSSLVTYWCLVSDVVGRPLEREVGLGLSQYRVLKYVSESTDDASLLAIARSLVLSRSQVGKIVSALEEGGFLARESSYAGHYASSVKVTARGRNLLAKCELIVAKAMMRFMLPAKPLFDEITLRSHTWIAAGLDASKLAPATTFGRGLDIGDVIRLGVEGAAKVEDTIAGRCRKIGLSKLEYRILLDLAERSDLVGLGELADCALAKRPNVAVAVKHLAATKLVSRRADPKDARMSSVKITSKGRAACDAVTEYLNEVLMSLNGTDPREVRETYIEISRICVDAERKRREAGHPVTR